MENMTLTRAEAEQIAKEAILQGWAEEVNSEKVTEHGEGEINLVANYSGGGWDRSQAADRHDWVPAEEVLPNAPRDSGEACRRCHKSKIGPVENQSCPGVWVNPKPDGTYHVELLFPGMYRSTEMYWITSTDDWRKLRGKVDELKEIIKQAVERGWVSGSFSRAPRKSGKLGMYIEIAVPGTQSYLPKRVGGMRTWKRLCREADSMIEVGPEPKAIEAGS